MMLDVDGVAASRSIECRRIIGLIADQKSQIDTHRAGQKQVVRATFWEMEADLSVWIEPDNFCFYPIGSHWALNPYRQRQFPKHGLLCEH